MRDFCSPQAQPNERGNVEYQPKDGTGSDDAALRTIARPWLGGVA
jgi:hypothetical protein